MSDFVEENSRSRLCFDWIKPVASSGSTSECYIVQLQGKRYFMKSLRREYAGDRSYRALFSKEYELGRSLLHPNLVGYEQLCDSDDECYILMENIVGESLDKFIESEPSYFESRKNLDKFFAQLLSVLKCLHENHVVYSDLKPQNIMITQVNQDVKLIDLGFCFADSYVDSVGTSKGYSSPEHQGKGVIDVSTDIYGVGKIIEFIGHHTRKKLPNVYLKIKEKCLKAQKQERFQGTDEIVARINKRSHTLRRTIIATVACIVLFLGYSTIRYTEVFNSWWDSFLIVTPDVQHDVVSNHTLYRILSETDRTCEAVGHEMTPNVYLAKTVNIDGKDYRLTKIAYRAFADKTHLRSLFIPEGVESIGNMAFVNCENLTSINIPNSVTAMGSSAFRGCNNINYVKLSDSITAIRRTAFSGCRFTSIDIPEGVTIIELDAFGNCEELEHVSLPESLVTLERGVFWNCGLKEITIPKGVTSMGEYLFFGCDSLKNIYNHAVEPQNVPPIHRNPKQITLHVPEQSVEAYRKAYFWKEMNVVPL